VTGTVGGTAAHVARTRRSGAGVSSRTMLTPVQPTCGTGRSGWSRACTCSAGPGVSGSNPDGRRMLTHSGGGGGRAGAGTGRRATT